ncbi:MAG TPA: bifunctional phosphoglucose/phosphomannose isomerase [Candidatus Paceibacterota bacterium]
MEDAIRNFAKQFEWEPKIENADKWKAWGKYLLCGMGGSHLQGDVFQNAFPGFDLSVYQDYGLPSWRDDVLKETLIIASSYSGNTGESLSSFEQTVANKYPVAAISTGGELLIRANQYKVPFIQVPDTGIQPRSALGYTFKALAKMVGREDALQEATKMGQALAQRADVLEQEGKQLAQKLQGYVPVIYTSNKNYSIAYNWKIKFNETGKIPAFYNLFPELNHNEMNGFDVSDSTRPLAEKFSFIFLQDTTDSERIKKRMMVLEKQLTSRGFPVETILLGEGSMLEKIFSSLLLADWIALYLAKHYGRDPEQVPMIEEFKKALG